jgi:tRNA A37 N6-isopentenylltransferase MiaA
MRRDTRRFARRQRTWLRKVADVRWLKPDEPQPILDAVGSFLSDREQP